MAQPGTALDLKSSSFGILGSNPSRGVFLSFSLHFKLLIDSDLPRFIFNNFMCLKFIILTDYVTLAVSFILIENK